MVFTSRFRAMAGVAAALLGVIAIGGPAEAAPPQAPCAGRFSTRAWCDTTLGADARAAALLEALTLDEKISVLAGDDLLGGPLGGFTDDWNIGRSDGVPRVGLPTLLMADGPAGIRQGLATAMPAPVALGASFDVDAARRYGSVVANEAKLKGNDVLFAPAVDVNRTPLSGRTFEAFGEDPKLTTELTVPWIQGAQGQGVIASVKHYPVYTQETDRFGLKAVVDARTMREIYLPPFQAAVEDGGAGMVMCAYTTVNGEPACGSRTMNDGVLRGEYGFRGTVVADFIMAAPPTDVAANGGLDLEMPVAQSYSAPRLRWELVRGRVTEATVDGHVRAILRTMFAFGLFDRAPYELDDAAIDRASHAATALEVEQGAITLLENDAALPLASPSSIAVIGEVADEFKGGGGSSMVRPASLVTPLQGITARAARNTVSYDPGTSIPKAVAAAKGKAVAVVFAQDEGTEFADKECLTLRCGKTSGVDQDALITAVAAANPNTVVVLETGGPVLTPWASKVRAVVEAWYPGEQGGTAIARMLFGDADPGGRLPLTFPAREGDTPTSGDPAKYPGVDRTVTFKEGVNVGYRHYDTAGLTPAFAFGHGLSYTTFGYSGLRIGTGGGSVSAVVTNTGARTGTAVPQLYLGLPAPDAATAQPPRQLKGFDKVSLAPGQSTRVTFPVSERDLSYWSATGWRVAPGCYRVMVGASSRDTPLTGSFARGGRSC